MDQIEIVKLLLDVVVKFAPEAEAQHQAAVRHAVRSAKKAIAANSAAKRAAEEAALPFRLDQRAHLNEPHQTRKEAQS